MLATATKGRRTSLFVSCSRIREFRAGVRIRSKLPKRPADSRSPEPCDFNSVGHLLPHGLGCGLCTPTSSLHVRVRGTPFKIPWRCSTQPGSLPYFLPQSISVGNTRLAADNEIFCSLPPSVALLKTNSVFRSSDLPSRHPLPVPMLLGTSEESLIHRKKKS